TDLSGRFTLRAPGAGSYRLRAERIGFQATESPALALAAGETRSYRMEGTTRAVTLEAVTAGARRRCEVRPEEGTATAAVWNEARKALDAAAYLQERQSLRFRVDQYTRDLTVSDLRVLAEDRKASTSVGPHPFRSLPAEQLGRDGYVQTTPQGTFYHAPDAQALLSDAFLDGHCFRMVPGEGENAARVGIAFQPVGGRRLPDVAGVLWVDRATRELSHIEYRYANLDTGAGSEKLGGRVEFGRSPGGGWIVQRWWVRMPAMSVDQSMRAVGNSDMAVERRARLTGIREQGGEVSGVFGADGTPLERAPVRLAVTGRVADHTGAPLAGAQVFISGTSHEAVADSLGEFVIPGLPAGEYTVSFTHPRLEALEVIPPQQRVAVVADGPPPAALLLASAAPGARRVPPRTDTLRVARADTAEEPVILEGVTARATRGFGGFYDRVAGRGVTSGHFLTRSRIDQLRMRAVTDLLATVPSLTVSNGKVYLRSLIAGTDNMSIVGVTPASRSRVNRDSDMPLPVTPGCFPTVYVDGQRFGVQGEFSLDYIKAQQVEGIEVYARDALAPPQFRHRGNECGVILIWTRNR
ncbi:MAG TPA: carboxypeptidase-like regulatory domain-containing protein, partial [Longimicrobium sp.]|nr:carboxypeptidase-like regulatory domain-containing protein [Longimicrobium sp.]